MTQDNTRTLQDPWAKHDTITFEDSMTHALLRNTTTQELLRNIWHNHSWRWKTAQCQNPCQWGYETRPLEGHAPLEALTTVQHKNPSAPYNTVTRNLEHNRARILQDHTTLWQEPLSTMGHEKLSGPYNSRSLQDTMMLDCLRTIWHKKSWGTNTIQDLMMQDNLWTIQHKNPHEPYYAWTLEDHTTLVLWRTMQWINTWAPYYTSWCWNHPAMVLEPSSTIQHTNPPGPYYARTLWEQQTQGPSRTIQCMNPPGP